jgi:hypothetical protein
VLDKTLLKLLLLPFIQVMWLLWWPLVICDCAQTKGERNMATYEDGNHTPQAHVLVDASQSHATRQQTQAKGCELFSRVK